LKKWHRLTRIIKQQIKTRHRASTENSLTFRVCTMSSYRGVDASL